MFEQFRLNRIARRLKRCKVVPKSNAQLRSEKVVVNGKVMKPLDYIDYVVKQFPRITIDNKPIDFTKRARDIYYKNGLKGLNLYVDYIRLRANIEKMRFIKAKKKQLRETAKSKLNLNNVNLLLGLFLSVTFNIAGVNPAKSIGTIKPMDGQVVRLDGYRSPAMKVTDTSIGPVFNNYYTMLQLGERGNLIMVAKPHIGGEEWLLRIKAILHLVQNVDEKSVNKQDIYYAIDVVTDMLPSVEIANKTIELIKEEKELLKSN